MLFEKLTIQKYDDAFTKRQKELITNWRKENRRPRQGDIFYYGEEKIIINSKMDKVPRLAVLALDADDFINMISDFGWSVKVLDYHYSGGSQCKVTFVGFYEKNLNKEESFIENKTILDTLIVAAQKLIPLH